MKKIYIISVLVGLMGISSITIGVIKNKELKEEPNIQTEEKSKIDTNDSIDIDSDSASAKTVKENSIKIMKAENVSNSKNLLSEKEAKVLLEERGFSFYDINYDYTIDGNSVEETVVDPNSDVKHPRYLTNYMDKKNRVWTIYIIENSIIAYCVSYTFESNTGVELLISETDSVTTYDADKNMFYTSIPKETYAIVKTVKRIDTEALDNVKYES